MRLFRLLAPPIILVVGLVVPLTARWSDSPSDSRVTLSLAVNTALSDSKDKTRRAERTSAGGEEDYTLEGEFLRSNCMAVPPEIVIGTLDGETTLYMTGEKNRRDCAEFTTAKYVKVKVGEKIDEQHFYAESFEAEGDNDNSDEEDDNND